MIELRNSQSTNDRRMDALVEFDERSREFPVSMTLNTKYPDLEPISKYWWAPTILDQEEDGACAAFSATHIMLNEPWLGDPAVYNQGFARELYFAAQRNDQWPGGEYPGADPQMSGTSMLAVAKELKKMGLIKGYEWAFRMMELILGVGYIGPAWVGTDWHEGMMEPDKFGEVDPVGRIVGRHAWGVYGYNHRERMFSAVNSWGEGWGVAGRFKISVPNMAMLLQNEGEVMFLHRS